MTIDYQGESIEYEIIFKAIKKVYFRFRDNKIFITANRHLTRKQIEDLLIKNIDKMKKRISCQQEKERLQFSYEEGEKIYLWGRPYLFRLLVGDKNIVVTEQEILCFSNSGNASDIMEKWYISKMKEKVTNEYVNLMGMIPRNLVLNELKIKKLKSRWGSCNIVKKEIVLNSQLAKLDEKYFYFVFLHEVAHLQVANHSANFYRFLDTLCQEHRKLHKEMKRYVL